MKALKIKRGNFFGVAYSADGRYLLSGNSGRHLRFWDLATFEERLHLALPHDARSGSLTFYLNGPRLVLGETVWDLTRAWEHLRETVGSKRPGKPAGDLWARIALENQPRAPLLADGATGESLLGVIFHYNRDDRSKGRMWDRQGRFQRAFDLPGLSWRPPALHPATGRLAGSVGHGALLIDLKSGKTAHTLVHTTVPNVLRFSPDGQRLAVAAGRCVWLWDVETGELLSRFPAFRCHAEGLAFHPGGNFLVAGSREGEVRVWDVRDGKQVAAFDWEIGAVHALAFAPDGMTIAAAGHNGSVMVWDFE